MCRVVSVGGETWSCPDRLAHPESRIGTSRTRGSRSFPGEKRVPDPRHHVRWPSVTEPDVFLRDVCPHSERIRPGSGPSRSGGSSSRDVLDVTVVTVLLPPVTGRSSRKGGMGPWRRCRIPRVSPVAESPRYCTDSPPGSRDGEVSERAEKR